MLNNRETRAGKGLVTVYMPTCNRLTLLQRAVDSVLSQTYPDIELIIVDDASTDGTWGYLLSLAERYANIRVFRQDKPQGACVARNIAIQQANGYFITGLDDDDEYTPERVATLVSAYSSDMAFVCHGFFWHYGGKSKTVDSSARDISLGDIFDYNFAGNQVLTETSKLRDIGGFDPRFVACQDYDTWTRLIHKHGPARRIKGASYYLHQGHTGPRVTSKPNKAKGYQQYYQKHEKLFTERNRANQRYMRRVALRESYSLIELLADLRFGFCRRKTRYFLSRSFPFMAQLRQNWLRK
ncbi:glycosyltransferase [Aliagarivorans marinus]|uniref:glycosyltransferase n=1 Tax=Aliagarivorans marinus TaxID=561965 RepID=UPI000427D52B|nr:glycosyltransferase [Aliagarivorans marinus]